ncbi:MAG: hypothetical protein QOG87_618 [Actinomycetota bacterium]
MWSDIAAAADSNIDVRRDATGEKIQYGGNIPGQAGGQKATGGGGGGGARGAAAKPVYIGRAPVLGLDSNGQSCVTTERSTFDTASEAANFEAAQEQRWRTLFSQYALCPGAELPQADPAVLAEVFWGEVLLPKPVPRIQPGWAMTGRLAYLETQAPMTQTFTRDTPLGPLTITATGEFLVDWGDGTRTGPHGTAGAPWPDGRITHGYVTAGTVDVVLTERWRATWTLAARTGTLTALSTEGVIADLPVREVQAVRNR